MKYSWPDPDPEQLIRAPKHRECSSYKCRSHFQNLALPFLPQYPEYSREELPLAFPGDLPANYTLIKSHYRTLARILHPDKLQKYARETPPPKSFSPLEPRRPFDPTNPMLRTPSTHAEKALRFVMDAHVVLIDARVRQNYEEHCTGLPGRNMNQGDWWNRGGKGEKPYTLNGWMDVNERERQRLGRKPWFWEYEYGLGRTRPLIVVGGIGWRESFWINFFPGFGERWGFINMDVKGKKRGGGQIREGRAIFDIDDMKIGGYGGDGTGGGNAETIVNLGHYYIDNYLPHSFSDFIWERCEDFRKWRGYGLTGGHYEIDPQTSKRTWKGPHGEWLALREAESAGSGSSIIEDVQAALGYPSTFGEHCEGRVWWVWIPSSAGGSVSDLGIGRLAGSGIDSLQGKSLTELPWSQRFHNTDKEGINNFELFDPDVMTSIKALFIGVLGFWLIVFCTWGMRRMKKRVKGEGKSRPGMDKEKEMKIMDGQPPARTPCRFDSNDWHSSESTSFRSDRRESIYSSGVSSDENTGRD